MTDSDVLGRVEALEAQVAELKSVQDLLMRLLSTTRPLANLLEYYGSTDAAEQALYNLLDELLAPPGGPSPANPRSATSGCGWPRFPSAPCRSCICPDAHRHDEGRPAGVPGLHAFMEAHGWPKWD